MQAAELMERFGRSSKRMKKYSAQAMSKIDLTLGQVEIIHFLFENEGKKVTQKDIEKEFFLSHATINGFVQRLASKGLLVTKQDAADKRFKVVEPTERLKAFYMKAQKHLKNFAKAVDEKMTAEEQQTFVELFEKFDGICMNYVNNIMKEEENEQNS